MTIFFSYKWLSEGRIILLFLHNDGRTTKYWDWRNNICPKYKQIRFFKYHISIRVSVDRFFLWYEALIQNIGPILCSFELKLDKMLNIYLVPMQKLWLEIYRNSGALCNCLGSSIPEHGKQNPSCKLNTECGLIEQNNCTVWNRKLIIGFIL